MATCPHCAKDGIPLVAKWWAGSAEPARCEWCGGLSFVSTNDQNVIYGGASYIAIAGVIAGAVASNIWIAAAGPIIALVYYFARWTRAPLIAVTEAQASHDRKWGTAVLVVAAAVLALVLYVGK